MYDTQSVMTTVIMRQP